MRTTACVTALRAAAFLGAVVAGTTGAWELARTPLAAVGVPLLDRGPRAVAALPFDVVLLGACAAALVACATWLLATAAVAVTSYVVGTLAPGSGPSRLASEVAHRVCPTLLLRLLAAGLGVAVTAGIAAPATATAPGDQRGRLTGLPPPDRATASAPHGGRTVVVRTGQSLWSISAALLPADATDADVTTAWHRLHHANLGRWGRMGPDPDLVLPGTRLVVPHLPTTDLPDTDLPMTDREDLR